MYPKYSTLTVTLTILISLNAIHSLPIEAQRPNGPSSNQNLATLAAAGSPLSRPQTDVRNHQSPPKSTIRQDTQVKPIIPATSVSSASSQLSNIGSASLASSNAGPPSLTWTSSKPSDPKGNVKPSQPMLIHPDHLVEGSGAGPPSSKEAHRSRLDDTDDSDDDGDDEDYDDKDSSDSGLGQSGHVLITTQKPNMSGSSVETSKKPDQNDFYKPFRPAVTVPPLNPVNLNSFNNQERPTTSHPPPKPLTSPAMPPSQPTLLKQPINNITSVAAQPPQKFPSFPGNKTVTDYDYEDESGDEEMEETSVFEDNDNEEPEIPANKTHVSIPHLTPQVTNQRINTTKPGFSTTGLVTNTLIGSKQEESSTKLPPSKFETIETTRPMKPAQSDIFSPSVNKSNLTVASKPIIGQAKPSNEPVKVEDDEEDEEGDEEVEEDEEESSDLDDDSPDEEASPEHPGNVNTRPPVTYSNVVGNSQINQHQPASVSSLPTIGPQINAHGAAVSQAIPPSSLGNLSPGYISTIAPPIQPSVTVASFVTSQVSKWSEINRPITSTLTVTPIVSTSTARPNMHPNVSLTTSRVPVFVSPPTVAYQREQTSSPTAQTTSISIAPAYFPTTLRPYMTSPAYPTKRVMPVITTNVEPYDQRNNNLSNNDDSLTRQIYDKAKEAYLEADRTVRAAVDAVWPPNFNFDSDSLEPLLAQPIFFMLALGGAIICLVLLMMLVVYMISYQTKPRRYEQDDISIY